MHFCIYQSNLKRTKNIWLCSILDFRLLPASISGCQCICLIKATFSYSLAKRGAPTGSPARLIWQRFILNALPGATPNGICVSRGGGGSFCLKNHLNPSQQGFNKLLETFWSILTRQPRAVGADLLAAHPWCKFHIGLRCSVGLRSADCLSTANSSWN